MRWLWRNLKKTRFLYFVWILKAAINKRWGPLALILTSIFWFLLPIYVFNALARYDDSHMKYVKAAQETQLGFWTILIIGSSVLIYLISRLYSWMNLTLDVAQGIKTIAIEKLENYENKLEALNHA